MQSISTHWLYHAARQKTPPAGEHPCLFCGFHHSEPTPVSQVIGDTFTNHGMCRVPGSPHVCPACTHYFTTRWRVLGHKKDAEYRLQSLRVHKDSWLVWKRQDMRRDIEGWLHAGQPGGVYVISLAKKKHLLPLAVVNPPGRSFTVQVEEEKVRLDPMAWPGISRAFDALLALGFLKSEILSGSYSAFSLRKAGATAHLEHDRVIAPFRPSGILTLLSYVTLLEKSEE